MAEEGWRPATSDDLPRLVELAALSIEEKRAQKGGELWLATAARRPPLADGFAAELADERSSVLVGTLDGAVLGYGACHVQELGDGRLLGVVTDLFVEPQGREVGIGEALMQALVDWCAAQGCFGVDSVALPGDRSTKNFFESFGLTARAIVVHRSLS
jgi:GNAT superfamily N-acetyltransferase